MAKKKKIDGVVVGSHYDEDGLVEWVRIFIRRGAVFSDRVNLSRPELISAIKSGKYYVVGNRVEFLAGSFQTSQALSITQHDGFEYVVTSQLNGETDEKPPKRDELSGVPVL